MSVRPMGPELDENAIREFLATDYPPLVGAVALIVGSRATAEDTVQEALARAWERSDRGERIESLRAWVMTVAINLSRSGWRRSMAERRAHDRMRPAIVEVLSDPSDSAGALVDLRRAVDGLPPRQRQAIVLHYYLGMPVAEIGQVLGIDSGSVKTSLFRGRRALAAALGERHAEEEPRHV